MLLGRTDHADLTAVDILCVFVIQVKFAEQQVLRKVVTTAYTPPTDPNWRQEWFLVN